MLPNRTARLLAYEDAYSRSSFDIWFRQLEPIASAKVAVALVRLECGHVSNVKSVGAGVHELKVNYGPGYRVYFGKEGGAVIILLGGGTKKRQSADIRTAKLRWADYKARKRKGRVTCR
ncbi:MAG: type II toxin-antitoxin system RelE/ParE family toxin [Deltaproteobacteria bacterium]|nr:MAG: type II toxin-antitoxin system RelE/ParE family toxin [Deltaproteobacteria bacterium]